MKTAVVTGAGRGLGRLIARGLAHKGYAVLATDIEAEWARNTAGEIGGSAWSMRQDVRDPESHREVARAAAARGALEVWVNNAGVLQTGALWGLDDDEVRRHVEVNLFGVIWGSRAAVDAMRAGGGHIINLGSMSALVPIPGLAVYGATKHAVLGLSLALQGDLERAGVPISVSTICPDVVDTEMVSENADVAEASLLFMSKKPLAPQDVADAVTRLVDRPRLQTVMPAYEGLLAHVFRPFPGLSLRAIRALSWLGDRNRQKRG